jgi:hypothetical protein
MHSKYRPAKPNEQSSAKTTTHPPTSGRRRAVTPRLILTPEDRAWLDMAPVGREFGSRDFERKNTRHVTSLVSATPLYFTQRMDSLVRADLYTPHIFPLRISALTTLHSLNGQGLDRAMKDERGNSLMRPLAVWHAALMQP